MGYIGASIVQIYPEYNLKIVTGMPKYEALDSVSRYESAKKCHQCMIEVFGHPQKEEALSVDDIQQQKFLGRGIYEIVVVIHTDYPIQRLDTWFFAKNPILMLMATDKTIYT